FQAEDGIRGFHVTGVQTCALPISGIEPIGGVVHRVSSFSPIRNRACTTGIGIRWHRSSLEGIGDEVRTRVVSDVRRASLEIGYVAGHLQAIGLPGANLENVIRLPIPEKPRSGSARKPFLSHAKRQVVHSGPGEERSE